ncbi:HD domain-containing phosphohydrolase [Thalassotalea sp. PLHSN55]|uniref:HD domain-containing phosphohydrolase n=1 Tax=Thalassotalea sp. PLHSN55 TaxID=3435888 RepID=UPI003F82DF7D
MDNFKNLHVLICDDSITNSLILTKLVSEQVTTNITTVTDPRKIEHTLQNNTVDLILLDLEMPHLSGFEVMKAVRRQFNADQLPILIITGVQGVTTRNKALTQGANDFLNKPFDQVEVILRVKNLLKIRQSYLIHQQSTDELERAVKKRTEELDHSIECLLYSLALAGELKDDDTGRHVLRVGKYARVLAEGYGLPNELVTMIEQAAPLHDIGKIGIPDKILLKPARLDQLERSIMNQHTNFGHELIGGNSSVLIQMAQSIAYSHHERWDGTGYPNKLQGESIPIEGRITAIADVFDALTTQRPYKKAWEIPQAIDYIENESGRAFDPALISVFHNNVSSFTDICRSLADEPDKSFDPA